MIHLENAQVGWWLHPSESQACKITHPGNLHLGWGRKHG